MVFGVALGLRLWNITFGLPAIYRPDEDVVVGRAMGVLHGIPDPHFADWPHLYFYVSAVWIWLLQRVGAVTGDMGTAYLAVRVLDALLGTATVLAVYALGRWAYGRAAGLAASAALAVTFLHVRDSHFATLDVPLTLACTLALLAAYAVARIGRARHAVLAGVAVGIAAGIKYSGALAIAAAATALEVRLAPRHARGMLAVGVWAAGIALVGVAVFLLSSPFLALEPAIFRAGLTHIFQHLASETTSEIGWVRLVHLGLWHGLVPPLFALTVAGTAYAAYRREPLDWILLAFLLAYYGLIGSGFSVFVRYADPMLPPLTLLAGRALADLAPVLARWTPPAVVLGAGLLIALPPALVHDIAYDQLIGQTDTRTLAYDWLIAHVPAGQRIAAPYFAGPLHDQALIDGGGHSHGAADRYVAAFLQNRLVTEYTVHELTDDELDHGSLVALRADGVAYLVYATNHPDAGCAPPSPLERALQAQGAPLVVFAPTDRGCPASVFDGIDAYYVPLSGYRGWVRPGPLISIYRLG